MRKKTRRLLSLSPQPDPTGRDLGESNIVRTLANFQLCQKSQDLSAAAPRVISSDAAGTLPLSPSETVGKAKHFTLSGSLAGPEN